MRDILASIAVGLGLVIAMTPAVFAGEQYVDETGYAVSGYDVVAYFDMTQAPVGGDQPDPVPGNAAFTADYNGATWAFASAANRDRFAAAPASFAPVYDGHCAYGVAQGNKVPANPELWRIVDGKLYLNITRSIVAYWEEDIPGNLATSDINWTGLEPEPAASTPVPRFDIGAAPLG